MSESKTPRTDEATILEPYLVRELSFEVVTTDFARQIETELAASKARETQLRDALKLIPEDQELPAYAWKAIIAALEAWRAAK